MPSLYSSLPKSPGVYIFKDRSGQIIYIGKAKLLRDRVSSYFNPRLPTSPKTRLLVAQIANVNHVPVESEVDALILEANLIRQHQPKYNFSLKDDKTYPRVEITLKDKVPLVRIVHHEETPGAVYFGPYPIGTEAVKMLRMLRRIFPFVSQRHAERTFRPCFRSHLGLCPCASAFTGESGRRKYRREIGRLIDFLSGKRRQIQAELRALMNDAARKMDFEKAAEIKTKLDHLGWMVSPKINPGEYQANPDLLSDIRERETADLEKILGISGLSRIEGYDISNTSGQLAAGSMVVFVNGTSSKKDYRRFRIKTKLTPDDPRMIEEVISRRLRHVKSWGKPDLIVLDGGRNQLAAARRGLAASDQAVPTVALAKAKEELYLQPEVKIRLPIGSPALNLLMRLRDEAHRFSRTYHFLLRRKRMLT